MAKSKKNIDKLFDEVEEQANEVKTRYEYTVDAMRKNTEGKSNNETGERLLQYIERAERLMEERSGINDDIRDVMTEANSAGFHVPTIRQVIKFRATDHQKRVETRELFDLYCHAIGLDV